MGEITEKVRQRFKFLRLVREINDPDLALDLDVSTKSTIELAISQAKDKADKKNGKLS